MSEPTSCGQGHHQESDTIADRERIERKEAREWAEGYIEFEKNRPGSSPGSDERVTHLRTLVGAVDRLDHLLKWQETAFEVHPNLDLDIEFFQEAKKTSSTNNHE